MFSSMFNGQFTPVLLGGMISVVELGLIFVFLAIALGMRSVLEDEVGQTQANGLAFGIWFLSSAWTYFWL
jgi:ABC-type thiamin/hydroxymethylpyrimidine transport system permease subunit